MQPLQLYKKPSITEAVLNLRVNFPFGIAPSVLKDLQRSIEPEYSQHEEIAALQGQIQGGSSVTATASQSLIGYRSISKDEKKILQVRIDGFTLSWLAPYMGWDVFRDEARRLWEIYRANTNPESINRVAVRYINRLDLPLPLTDFKDYLQTVPEVSPALPQGLSDYFMQLEIPQEDLQGSLILNEAIIPPPNNNVVSVLLDIDLFCFVNIPVSENTQWDLLEKLRVRKNEVFEACITDKTRELLK